MLEALVAGAWHEVLGIAPASLDEDFFAAGGHSLAAAELAARIEELLGVEVPLTMVFDHPTVAGQATYLGALPRPYPGGPTEVVLPYPAAAAIAPLEALNLGASHETLLVAAIAGAHLPRTRVTIAVDGAVALVELGAAPTFVELVGKAATAVGQARAAVLGFRPPVTAPVEASVAGTAVRFADAERARGFAATVAALATRPTAPAVSKPSRPPAPLTRAQERLWFLDRLQPGTTLNHIQHTFRLEGDLDPEAVRRALVALAARQPGLRTRIAVAEGVPQQIIESELVLDHAVETEAVEVVAQREYTRAFDLTTGPLWRTRLVGERLVVTAHHVIVDMLSMQRFLRDLSELYRAEVEGTEARLSPLETSMGELAQWERSPAGRDRMASDVEYWLATLAGAQPLELPLDFARPAEDGLGRHKAIGHLDTERAEAVRALARAHGTSQFVVLIAAAFAFLARHTGRDDIVAIVPAGRRDVPGRKAVIGLLLNLLPVRLRLDGDPTFTELVERTQQAMREALLHADAPFERVIAALGRPREPGRQPLFDVIFNMLPWGQRHEQAGVAFTTEHVRGSAQPCDLVLGANVRKAGALDLVVRCREDLFAASTAERFAARFATLVHGAATRPAQRLSELPLLPPEERTLVVETWNRTAVPLPETTVHDLVLPKLDGALAARSERVMSWLRAQGVTVGTRVGVVVPPSWDLVVAALGVMRAGGVYVPIDTQQPVARIDLLRGEVDRVLDLAELARAEGAGLRTEAPRVSPDAGAYIVFTSGSTGRPKGVATTHRGLVNQIEWFAHAVPWQPGEVSVLRSSPAFVDAMWELFGPLAAGVPLAIASPEEMADPRRLAAMVERVSATRMVVVPSLVRTLLELGAPMPSLRLWLATSEELTPALVRRFRARRPHDRLVNLYGASETADQVAAFEVTGPDALRTPIGTPIANSRIYVLDAGLRPVPIGVVGELGAAGVGVSSEYLTGPDPKLVEDPFVPGARMYRTGDLGRWRHDGLLEYVGRADHRLKVRGVRIDPGEVEAAIASQPGITDVVVTAQADRLVAHVVGDVDAATLRAALRTRLPERLIPTQVIVMTALPLGPTGKVDRRALPLPVVEAASPLATRAPDGPLEEAVAYEWTRLLDHRVGADEDFFAAGGQSLVAAQLGARLAERFGVDVPLAVLFEHPTVAAQAAWLHAAMRGGVATPITPAPAGLVAASFAQERLWFATLLAPHAPQPKIRVGLRIDGALDEARLERALVAIATRHPALRTGFEAGPPLRQRVMATMPRDHRVEDLTALAPAAQDARVHAVLDAERTRAFELAPGPPWRTVLLRLGPARHVLLVTMHHLVTDGVSLQLWLDELHAHYSGEELPPVTLGAADIGAWQRTVAEAPASTAYWRTTLGGAPVLDLPLRAPRTAWSAGSTERVRGGLTAEETAALAGLATQEHTTLFGVLLAAAGVVLARASGQHDFVVGTMSAGRDRPELRPVIGLFLNPLALRCDVSGDPTVSELVQRASETVRSGLVHGALPFERVVAAVNPARAPFRQPLFDVVLNHHPVVPPPRLGDLRVEHVRGIRTPVAPYELMIRTLMQSRGLGVQLDFQRERFDEATVAGWLADYLAVLRAFGQVPSTTRISRLATGAATAAE